MVTLLGSVQYMSPNGHSAESFPQSEEHPKQTGRAQLTYRVVPGGTSTKLDPLDGAEHVQSSPLCPHPVPHSSGSSVGFAKSAVISILNLRVSKEFVTCTLPPAPNSQPGGATRISGSSPDLRKSSDRLWSPSQLPKLELSHRQTNSSTSPAARVVLDATIEIPLQSSIAAASRTRRD